jgi:hypothetical protein
VNLLRRAINSDETWIFQYDPETKWQYTYWKTYLSSNMKKARMSKLKLKAMLIVFDDVRGVL